MTREPPSEENLFAEDELAVAFERIMDIAEARQYARELLAPDTEAVTGAGWQLTPDTLDLLSLVSDDCAERVRRLLMLSPEDAAIRRTAFASRIG